MSSYAGSDHRSLTPGNSMVKFADDTYVVNPSSKRVQKKSNMSETGLAQINFRLNHVQSMEIVKCCIIEMPTCCGDPFACCSNHPKSRGNEGTGREHQQEIFCVAARQPSSCNMCAVAVCTAHSATSWPADRRSSYGFSGQSSLKCHARHLHGGDSPRLLIVTA